MEDKIVVGAKEFTVGKPNAAQVAGVVRIFARMNLEARGVLSNIDKPTEMDYVMAFLSNVDEDTLLTLAALSLGVDKQFAAENFDLGWVTQALAVMIRNSNIAAVITNFTSMLSPTEQ